MPLPILAARRLTKKFPGVTALRGVSFELQAGEIHALCGENGAGKSTLIKLLSGLHPFGSYEGDLTLQGEAARFQGISDSQRAGIAVIYQELALIDEMSVAENIFLGVAPQLGPLISWSKLQEDARRLLDRFGVAIDPATPLRCLGVGQKQLVEILKALARNSRILILDEPTAALAEHEVQTLLAILRDLRSRGLSCIYISHRLEEVFALADRVTVLRDGSTIWSKLAAETNRSEVIRAMVGREIADLFPLRPARDASRPSILKVQGLSVGETCTGRPRLRDISFTVAPGEVLGLGGLMGAGRTELIMHLFGAWGVRHAGSVELEGVPLPPLPPREMIRHGVVLVSEDRRRYGLILSASVGFNLSLSSLARFARGCMIDRGAEFQEGNHWYRSLHIKAPSLESFVGQLSGGNQQKVVLGKALMTDPQVVFLDEPTRGIDIGAKEEIYALIREVTAAGKAVILVSSELPELIGLSDRILILRGGQVSGVFRRDQATPEKLLSSALGGESGSTPGEEPKKVD